ncbi:helix-turn-helix domain-containing protein [Streptomyces erythrochromogenes]|uniref:helix-turn-helix domain-containing protein n=1 Tax=Streptomyces erythrochromogenes TaxID=285574 RepID=UPI00380E21D6
MRRRAGRCTWTPTAPPDRPSTGAPPSPGGPRPPPASSPARTAGHPPTYSPWRSASARPRSPGTPHCPPHWPGCPTPSPRADRSASRKSRPGQGCPPADWGTCSANSSACPSPPGCEARLRAAMDAARGGANPTEAAHAAGFADGAHLTRTFRAMFGITPSRALGGTHWQNR